MTRCWVWLAVALSLGFASRDTSAQSTFVRGECNGDGLVDIADPIRILNQLFSDDPDFSCEDACDINDDGLLDLSDAIYGISFLFSDGTEPPAPFPSCGDDASADSLECASTEDICPPAGLPPVFESTPPEFAVVGQETLYQVVATDPESGPSIVYSLTAGRDGASLDSGTGLFSWIPDDTQLGSNDFVIEATDDVGLSSEQLFSIQVRAAPEIISAPAVRATEGASYEYVLIATDLDSPDLEYSLMVSPIGMNVDPVSGVITWIPSFEQAGDHRVTVLASDGDLADTQSFVVTVTNVNRPPTIESIPRTAATEGIPYATDVDATDPDLDLLTYSLDVAPTGMDIDPATGGVSWTPDFDQAGDHPITVVASDGDLDDTQSFVVTVTNVNRPPVIDSVPITVATEGVPYSTDVDATDPDLDTLTYSLDVAPAGMEIDPGTGVVTWIPDFDQAGDHPITVIASDSDLDDTRSFTVTVTNVNRPPMIVSVPITVATEGVPYSTDVEATDPDLDPLTYSLTVAPVGMSVEPSTGVVSWTPGYEQAGDHPVTVLASDGDLADTQFFVVTVTNVNRPPTIDSAPITTATEDAAYSSDVDATDPDLDTVTYSLEVAPTGMEIDPGTGVVTWSPDFDQAGDHPVTVLASDGDLSDTQSFVVTVANVNRPPIITSTAPNSAVEATLYSYAVASDDPDVGDIPIYSMDVAPAGASIDGTGLLTWTPTSSQIGDHPFTVRATDPAGDFDTQSYSVVVTPLLTVVHRINAGGSSYTDQLGQLWDADYGFNTGSAASVASPVAGTLDDPLYQTERWDPSTSPELVYALPVPAVGQYQVRLHFTEIWDGITAPGQRVFDVSLEGEVWLDDHDPYGVAGGLLIASQVERTVTVADGELTISFGHEVQNPKISAIEVFRFNATSDLLVGSPTTIDFGLQDLGSSSAASAVQLTAVGTATITVSTLEVSGDFILEPSGLPLDLEPGMTADIGVRFSPTIAGTAVGSLSVAHTGVDSPLTISLVGTGVDAGALDPAFTSSVLSGESSGNPTTLQFGPDGRLYVGQQNGLIKVYTIVRNGPNDFAVAATETLDLVRAIPNHNDDGSLNAGVTNRQITGLLVTGTAMTPVLYVTSSDPRIVVANPNPAAVSLDTNSGVLSRLTWTGATWDHVQLVRGLPRSEENHASNGMALDESTGTLYLAQGGHTNMGAPSTNFSFLPEYALSAAILTIDLDAIGDSPYDLPTLDDEDRPGVFDQNDPFGGNDGKNQAILEVGGPVQIYSSGWRNIYDVVLTASGRLYTVDNGPNGGWGGPPTDCSNTFHDGGNTYDDALHFVDGPGYYGGHPNPTRGSTANTFNPTNPQSPISIANPDECDYLIPSTQDGALTTFASSTNGLCEYVASNFGGAMVGDLLTASFDGKIYRLIPNAAGDALAEPKEGIFSGFGSQPLDIVAQGDDQVFPGTVWVAVYGPDTIVCFEPDDYDGTPSPCSGAYDTQLDEDGDGYTNADELDNSTSPCSAASTPSDADGDFVSDLNDADDDNDGIDDSADTFALDPDNGNSTSLPLLYSWNNGEPSPGGILGLGFTGLMTNGSDYSTLFDPDAVIASGAAGVFSIPQVPGGDATGSTNDQLFGFQFGIPLTPTSPSIEVTTRLLGPFSSFTPSGGQSFGLFAGTGTQDDFVRVVVHANGGAGGIQITFEDEGIDSSTMFPSGILDAEHVDLTLRIDPSAATIVVSASIDFSAPSDLGSPIAVPPHWFTGPNGLAVGVMATSVGATPFPASWDFLRIDQIGNPNSDAAAELTVTPSGSIDASTYTSGSIQILNTSPSGQRVTRVRLDLSPSVLPDLVFDPLGTAGDLVAKCFTPNQGAGLVGLVAPPDPCLDPFDVPNDAGYSVIDLSFTEFDPGELFTFSVDIDPSSIQGVTAPGPGESGSVSGLELTGARLTVQFDDGGVRTNELFRIPASQSGSTCSAQPSSPAAPTLDLVGVTPPDLVTLATQTLRVTGPPDAMVRILQLEAAIYLSGVPAGGFDVEPFEANSVIAIQEFTVNLGPTGIADVPVTLTRTDTEGGLNTFVAVVETPTGQTGRVSNTVVVELSP